jgi:hypothetical protein
MNLPQQIIQKIKSLHIKRVFSVLLAAALFVVAFPAPAVLSASQITPATEFVLSGLDVQDAPQGPATIGLEITGQVPVAQTGNLLLDNALNERWTQQYNAFVQNHMAGALSIDSRAEFFTSYEFVSVAFIKEAASVSTTAVISTTVINASTGNIISLTDFNVNILQLINNYINSLIAARPHSFASFSGVDADHPFYLDGDRLVIPFGSAELIPTDRGIHYIVLSIFNIEEEFFPSSYFRVLPPSQYSTIMIRVADVMRRFGYEVNWDNDTRTVNISMNGIPVSTLVIDENAYYYHDSSLRELEVAPMLFNNWAYVPLSFFNEIVGIPTTVNSDGITVSRYGPAVMPPSPMYHGFLMER